MLVIHTNSGIPDEFAACTRGPLILIRPEYRDDAGLLAHEKVHRRQWLRTLGLHTILYKCSVVYRLASELEAYAEQSKCYADDRTLRFAEFVATKYDIAITVDAAHAALLEELGR